MRSVNKVTLIGNLTRDPEFLTTAQGSSMCKIGLATSREWKDQGGTQHEETEFHNLIAWSKLADIAVQYLKKGSPLYIEGRLTTRKYTDKTGVDRSISEIIANDLIFFPTGQKREESSILDTGAMAN